MSHVNINTEYHYSFKRIVYIQLLSATMEANKKSKEETKVCSCDQRDDVIMHHVMQAEDQVTEKVVTNGDTVTHPSTRANGNEPTEPCPLDDIENSEHHSSILTNGIDQSITSSTVSDGEHIASNEGHGDLSSMANGRCSPVEKQTTGLTSQQQSSK